MAKLILKKRKGGQKWPMDGDTGKFWEFGFWSPADWVSNLRAFLAPVLAAICVFDGRGTAGSEGLWAGWWLVWLIVGLSDKVDGILARRFGSCQRGETNDEQSDKICLFSAFTACIVLGIAPWPWLVLMMTRDILVTYVRGEMRERGDRSINGARWLGKAKTVVQFAIVVVAMMPYGALGLIPQHENRDVTVGVLVLVAVALSLISGWQYFRVAMLKLRRR